MTNQVTAGRSAQRVYLADDIYFARRRRRITAAVALLVVVLIGLDAYAAVQWEIGTRTGGDFLMTLAATSGIASVTGWTLTHPTRTVGLASPVAAGMLAAPANPPAPFTDRTNTTTKGEQ